MKDPMFIWLPEDVSAPWDYVHGGVLARAHDAAQKSALSAQLSGDCIAVVAGTSVRRFLLDIPKMREGDRLNAAKFAVEDQLGTGLKDQHVSIGAYHGAGKCNVAVIKTAYMTAVIDALSASGLSPRGVYADHDMVDAPCRFQGRVIVPATDTDVALTCDEGWADARYDTLGGVNVAAISAVPRQALNLRSGVFSARGALSLSGAKLWPIAVLFIAGCAASLFVVAGESRAISAQAADIRTETARLYTEVTGKAAPSNPALQVMRALNSDGQSGQSMGSSSAADFLTLSGGLFSIIAKADGVSVDSLRYDAASGQLNLQLIYPDFDSGSRVETLARAEGFVFDTRGVREQGGAIRADATLTIGGQDGE